MDSFVVLSTAGSKREANRIAKTLVEKRLAACVNVLSAVESHYIWEGKMNRSREVLMMIKTTARQAQKLTREIKKMHSYEVPEILWLRVAGGERAYLQWLGQSTVQFRGNRAKK